MGVADDSGAAAATSGAAAGTAASGTGQTRGQGGDAGNGVQNTYVIRPNYRDKFRPVAAKAVIESVLAEKLAGLGYHSENTSQWTREIADDVKNRLKTDLNLERYKYVVQVVIGEQRGEGVRMASRCFWDSDTDNFAQAEFVNDSMFCVAAAWGVYLY